MELRGGEGAQRSQRAIGPEPSAHRAHLGDAPHEVLGEQPDDERQDVVDKTHPACDPAHRPRKLDGIAAQRIGRRGPTRRPLGVRHHRLDLVELARKPCRQTVGQQAEGGVAVGAVPASDVRPARGLARVGAVACQRAAPVGVIRAARKPCTTPRLGTNVFLAGKPRLVAKLHRSWPGGVRPPRGPTPLSCEGAPRLRRRRPRRQAVTMWTRPTDRAASCGACGQGMDKCCATCPPLAPTRRSRAHILTASATTTHEKGNGDGSGRLPDCSVFPSNPSTEQSDQFPG